MQGPDTALDSEELGPTELCTSSVGHAILIDRDRLTVRYTGDSRHSNDVGAVQANRPVPKRRTLFYYEITIVDEGQRGKVAIGFADKTFKLNRQPGWEAGSYGYHGDDGKKFYQTGSGEDYGPRFGSRDVVGAGIYLDRGEMFFTKNGARLPIAFRHVRAHNLYPTIGLHSKNECVEVNFGHKPFMFDVQGLITEERYQQDLAVHRTKLPSSELSPLALVASYLEHCAYGRTLAALTRTANLEPLFTEAGIQAVTGLDQPQTQPHTDTTTQPQASTATTTTTNGHAAAAPTQPSSSGQAAQPGSNNTKQRGGRASGRASGGKRGSGGRGGGRAGGGGGSGASNVQSMSRASSVQSIGQGEGGGSGAGPAAMEIEPPSDTGSDRPQSRQGVEAMQTDGDAQTASTSGMSGASHPRLSRRDSLLLRQRVRELITLGQIDKAMDTIRGTFPQILQSGSGYDMLLYQLYRQKLIELTREGRVSDALQWVQSALYPLVVSHPILEQPTKDTLALLAYSEPETSPLAPLLSDSERIRVADYVNGGLLCAASGVPFDPDRLPQAPLVRSVKHLVTVCDTRLELNGGQGTPLDLQRVMLGPLQFFNRLYGHSVSATAAPQPMKIE